MTMSSALRDTAVVAERRETPRSCSKRRWAICAFEPVVMRLRADARRTKVFFGKPCKSATDMSFGLKLAGRLRRFETRRIVN